MQGYDREDAVRYMLANINRKEFQPLVKELDRLLPSAIQADLDYMVKAGVIDAEGFAGSAYYDDDEAFEFLLDALTRMFQPRTERDERALASFVDEYMEVQQRYMEQKGMLDWD